MGKLTPGTTRALGWVAGVLLLVGGLALAAPHLASSTALPSPVPTLDPAMTPRPTMRLLVKPSPPPLPTAPPAPAPIGGAVLTVKTAYVYAGTEPKSRIVARLGPGVIVPVTSRGSGWFKVVSPCERRGWIEAKHVRFIAPATTRATTLAGSTIVVDPGHGGQQKGAVGPTGLREKDANLDIARRLTTLLQRAGARVVMTRTGDTTAGLGFRSLLADALAADTLVSVHHNAVPTFTSTVPGTEVYGQARSDRSKRLSALTHTHIVRTLKRFKIQWVSDPNAGPKTRLNAHGDDYYALLRRTDAPAVIVESMFISNKHEEKLLRDPGTRQLEADALFRGLEAYFPTVTPGKSRLAPYPRSLGGPSGLGPCSDP